MKRIRSAWLALASACAVTAAVGAARPHYGGTLRIELSDSSAAHERALPMVFETLTRVDAERGPQPLLAASWQSDTGGIHWRVRLREGTRLHDGSVLEGWQVAAALRSIERGWKIDAVSDLLTIDLPAPAPDLAWTLATPSHAIAVRTSNGARLGTGPFRLEREDDTGLSLRAYDDYREGRPFVDSVDMKIRPAATLLVRPRGRQSGRRGDTGHRCAARRGARAMGRRIAADEPDRAGVRTAALQQGIRCGAACSVGRRQPRNHCQRASPGPGCARPERPASLDSGIHAIAISTQGPAGAF